MKTKLLTVKHATVLLLLIIISPQTASKYKPLYVNTQNTKPRIIRGFGNTVARS